MRWKKGGIEPPSLCSLVSLFSPEQAYPYSQESSFFNRAFTISQKGRTKNILANSQDLHSQNQIFSLILFSKNGDLHQKNPATTPFSFFAWFPFVCWFITSQNFLAWHWRSRHASSLFWYRNSLDMIDHSWCCFSCLVSCPIACLSCSTDHAWFFVMTASRKFPLFLPMLEIVDAFLAHSWFTSDLIW